MANLLAFDTSTEWLHIGLAVGDGVWRYEGAGGALASSSLIPRLRELLADAGIGWRDLDAIAFGRGPGAFTGIRTACAAAQGLAAGAGKPVLSIDSLMAVAEDARQRAGADDVWVAMDARMDELYAAHYQWADGTWRTLAMPALYTLVGLHARWKDRAPLSVAGSAPDAFGIRLHAGSGLCVADAQPRGDALLACAGAAWLFGAATEAAMALPHYVRDQVAFTTSEREAMRLARATS